MKRVQCPHGTSPRQRENDVQTSQEIMVYSSREICIYVLVPYQARHAMIRARQADQGIFIGRQVGAVQRELTYSIPD